MPRNVEVKIRVADLARLAACAAALGAEDRGEVRQVDTYFHAPPPARLKLREENGMTQLVAYARPDRDGLRTSDYRVVAVANTSDLKSALELVFGVVASVVKERRLLILGRTRIHLDTVEGLGEFVELEVALAGDEPVASGEAEAARILGSLGLGHAKPIACSYADLLEARIAGREREPSD